MSADMVNKDVFPSKQVIVCAPEYGHPRSDIATLASCTHHVNQQLQIERVKGWLEARCSSQMCLP